MDIQILEQRREMGLPDRFEPVQVIHNESSGITILELKLPFDNLGIRHRLYWRRYGTTVYGVLGALPNEYSYEHAVTCALPIAFFCAVEWRPFGDTVGGRPQGLLCARLGEAPEVSAVDLGSILGPKPPKAFIRRLVRASDSGERLDAIVGFNEEGPVNYHLCRIDLLTLSLTRLDALPGVWY